jgi:hypothetical protein
MMLNFHFTTQNHHRTTASNPSPTAGSSTIPIAVCMMGHFRVH